MLNKFSLRLGVIAVSVATAFGSYASVQDVTETVKGRPATVSNVTIKNKSAENLNPALGDILEATYTYTDPDGIPEDTNQSAYRWLADGTAAGETVGDNTFVPGSPVLNKFLQVQITAAESAPSDPDKAAMVESSQTNAPVLPSRTEFNSLYHFSPNSMRWGDAYMYCANRNERLMSVSELQDLFVNYTRAASAPAAENNSDLNQTYGVGLSNTAWATGGNGSSHSYVYINTDGHSSSNTNDVVVEVVCAKYGPPELLPSVSNVTIQGNLIVSETLTANYTYNGNSTIPDYSRFQWFRMNSLNDTAPVEISGANTKNYVPVMADTGKYLRVRITPASYDTVSGVEQNATTSAPVQPTEVAFNPNTTFSVNGQTFSLNSGFPSTGFIQAKFQVLVGGSSSGNGNYTWSTDQPWVSVDGSGNVTFTGTPNSSTKTFKIKALSGDGITLHTKSFTVNKWFLSGTGAGGFVNWSEAANYCSTRGGQPAISELTNAVFGVYGTRVTGKLWGEWGPLPKYSGSGFKYTGSSKSAFYWSSQSDSGDNQSNPSIADLGDISLVTYNTSGAAVCRTNL